MGILYSLSFYLSSWICLYLSISVDISAYSLSVASIFFCVVKSILFFQRSPNALLLYCSTKPKHETHHLTPNPEGKILLVINIHPISYTKRWKKESELQKKRPFQKQTEIIDPFIRSHKWHDFLLHFKFRLFVDSNPNERQTVTFIELFLHSHCF